MNQGKEHLLEMWTNWAQDDNIPDEELEKWTDDPKRLWHCNFCGEHGELEDTFSFPLKAINPSISPRLSKKRIYGCRKCGSYKGLTPCIPGARPEDHTDYCHWGENPREE